MLRGCLFLLVNLVSLPLLAVEDIVVLALFADKAMLRIDGNQKLLRVGEQSPEGVRLIAADSERATIEFEGMRRELQLGTHISSAYAAPQVKRVQIWPDSNGMYSASGTINGRSVGFLIDTGANMVALNANDAARIGIDYLRKGSKIMSETASGTSWVYLLKLDSVSVGVIKLYNVEAVVFDGPHPSRALLGLSFLNRIKMKRNDALLTLEQH